MAKVTSDNLKEILSLNDYEANILEYYDNVTYNIRFYMLPHAFQKRLSEERLDFTTEYKIPDNQKIIIAETGVSSKYDISSLHIYAVHASAERNPSAATYKMELRLTEISGCDLVNKIAVISNALGYQSYIHQPYHLDIWFSGYEQSTGKPVKIIEDIMLTYEVIISEVSTNTDNSGTMYNFIMTPVPQSCMNKSVDVLFKIGEISPENGGGNTFGDYVKRIIDLINKKYFEENYILKNTYIDEKGSYEYLILNKNGYKLGNDIDYNQIHDFAVLKYRKEKEANDDFYKNGSSKLPTISFPKNISISPWSNYVSGQSLWNNTNDMPKIPEVSINDIKTVSFDTVEIDDFISSQNSDSIQDGKIQYNTLTTFEEALQDLCFNSKTLKEYVVRPKYTVKYLRNHRGIECKKIYVDLIFTKNYYLNYFQQRGIEKNYSYEAEQRRRSEMQNNEARNLILNRILKKKYEWFYNGHNTSLIEFNSNMDKLWYANIGLINIKNVSSASNDIPKEVKNKDEIISLSLLDKFDSLLGKKSSKLTIDEALEKSTKPFESVRGLASDKRLYIDDIYYCIDETKKNNFLNGRIIYEKNDLLSDSNTNADNSSDDSLSIIVKAGYGNIHSTGCLVDVELTILGDPFWLDLYSDNKLYNLQNNDFNKFHHFSFIVNSAINQGLDGQFNKETITEFSNIYQIVESESIFENGKFTQKLKGVIDPAFMHLARIEGL